MLRTPNHTPPRSLEDLLSPELAARIARLDLASRKIFSGKLKGERRSKKRGESVEFADHRPYVVGDDLRHIDWNIFGRLDRLFMKMFLEEEDLSLHLVIDCSESHDTGAPNKFAFMQRLGMALAYIGLINLNRVAVTAIGAARRGPEDQLIETSGGIVGALRDLRGRRRVSEIGAFLCSLEPVGGTPFAEACRRIALTRRGKGVMVLLSDMLIKEGYEQGLRMLVGHGYDLVVVQVLAPQELDPTIAGDLRLRDVEDADAAEITITAPLLKHYKATVNAYCNRLHAFCAQRDIQHMLVTSDQPIDAIVLDALRRKGVLR